MRRNRRFRVSPSMAVALLALFVALGGSAFAVATINGKNIKNRTVVGKKLKNNTVTGKQVKESTLGKVKSATSADKAKTADSATTATTATNATNAVNATNATNAASLAGLAPSALLKGTGNQLFASKSTGVSTNDQEILAIPGIGIIRADCGPTGITATLEFVNTSGGSLNVIGTSVESGAPATLEMSPNVPGLNNGLFTTIQTRDVGQSTVQAWNSQTGKSATFVVSNIFCLFNAEAVTNQQ